MHASPEVLEQYLLGDLPPRDVDVIHAHLSSCDVCQKTLSGLEQQHDTMVLKLRQPRSTDPYELERPCQEMVSRIEALSKNAATDAPDQTLAVPDPVEMLRDYRLLEPLGTGGMGTVYRALHTKLGRVVAVKVLPPEKMSAAAIARFEREMQIIGQLDHPHIVRATDAGVAEGKPFLVMELLDGVDLDRLVRERGPLDVSVACAMIRQAALGLQYAFEQGVVHRDIKPSNLMLARIPNGGWQVKVLDLGLALFEQPLTAAGELTSDGQLMGTIDYMAPEQGENTHRVDIRADIYSLGATLFRLLTGSAPLANASRDSVMKKLMALASVDPPGVNTLRPDVPASLVAIVRRLLSKRPDDRPHQPVEVAVLLEPFARSCDLAALATDAETKRPVLPPHDPTAVLRTVAQSARRQQRRLIALAVMSFALLLAVLVFKFNTRDGVVTVQLDTPQPISTILVDGTKVEWTQGDDRRKFRFQVHPGAVSSIVMVAADGTKIHADIPDKQLTIAAGKDYTLTAAIQPAQAATTVAENQDRAVIDWVRSLGGTVGGGNAETGYVRILPEDSVPSGRFDLVTIDLMRKPLATDDFKQLDRLPYLTTLIINKTGIGDAALANLGDLPELKGIFVSETSVTDKGMESLARYRKMETFHAATTGITDKGVELMRAWSGLQQLFVSGCAISDASLDVLSTRTNLRHLHVYGTRLSKSGIERLRAALPTCKIESDFGVFEPTMSEDSALEFPAGSLVEIPTLKYDGGPQTVELTMRTTVASYSSFAAIGQSRIMFWGSENRHGVNLDRDDHTLIAVDDHAPPIDRTVRVACSFDGTVLFYFVDGKLAGKGNVSSREPSRQSGGYIGGHAAPSFRGRIDELRVSKTARYTADYVPVKRFAPDDATIALYHFDEGRGEILHDESGHGHDGTILGAIWVKNDP